MAAAALAHAVNQDDCSIVVVSDGDGKSPRDTIENADATLPWPDHLRVALELMDERMVVQSGGSFTLGIALSGWSNPDTTWFHPYSSLGAALGPVPFHHLVSKLRSEGKPLKLANYSLAALAAQAGRFAQAGANPGSVLSTCRHGLHVGTAELTRNLQLAAQTAGVVTVDGQLESVLQAPDGSIDALLTTTGQRIEGALYLDCTGSPARLIGETLQEDWEDWSDWMPCNRVISAEAPTSKAPLPYSHAEANDSGWTRYLPLQGKTALSGYFNDGFTNEDSVKDRFRQFAAPGQLEALVSGEFRPGRRKRAWRRNCLALGSAAALTDPVGVSNLQLLRFGINRLLNLLPASPAAGVEAAEYNRQNRALLNHVRDFTALHYQLNGRRREPFWEGCRKMPLGETAQYRVRLYERLGRVALYDEEPLEETAWIHLFDEQGIRPRSYSTMADGIESAAIEAHLQRVRALMIDAVGTMPLHGDYLSRIVSRQKSKQIMGKPK